MPSPDAIHPAPSPVAAVVVLAAGEGKRMKSARSKLLHELAGHSLLSYAIGVLQRWTPRRELARKARRDFRV